MPAKGSRRDLHARFWAKVPDEIADECREWTASRFDNEYGQFWYEGTQVKAHRMAYELTYGPIPEGMLVLHRCDNPPCCNPTHLLLGTNADNAADRDQKGRMPTGDRHWTHRHPEDVGGLPGSMNPRAKLNEQDVVEMREAHKQGVSGVNIAKRFGVRTSTVSLIVNRRLWTHLP